MISILKKKKKTRAVTEGDLIPPPALFQRVVLCTQTETPTDARTHGRTERLISVYPQKHSFCGG